MERDLKVSVKVKVNEETPGYEVNWEEEHQSHSQEKKKVKKKDSASRTQVLSTLSFPKSIQPPAEWYPSLALPSMIFYDSFDLHLIYD